MAGQVQLVFEPVSRRFDAQDERWLGQVAGLVADLRREAGGVSLIREPQTGAKGAAGSIVLSLASAGSLTAMVELARAWLSRDRTRSMKVSWTAEGDVQSVELAGNELDDAAFDELLAAVLRQVAGAGDESDLSRPADRELDVP